LTSESHLYVTAEEAAKILEVEVPSFYAYVGRKGIRSQPVPGQRARLYWREDVENMRRSKTGKVNWDSVLVPQTKITLITEEGPFYRGHSAVGLAESATLEDVAAILWEQDRSALFPDAAPHAPDSVRKVQKLLSGLTISEQAGTLLPLLERSSPRNYDRTSLGFARAGADLLRWFAALGLGEEPTSEPVHLVLARLWNAPPGYDDLIRRVLVLLADHELTPDTYAVRAVANAGCTPHQAVLAGIVANSGYRLTAGRVTAVRRLIDEIVVSDEPERPLIDRYRDGEVLPGFEGGPVESVSDGGHAGRDARAEALLRALGGQFGDDPEVRRLLRAVEVARDDMGAEPNIRLPYAFLERKLGVRQGDASLKVLGRTVGWIAHAFEQMASGDLIRPRTAYAGPLPIVP
jgi:citrate synthase